MPDVTINNPLADLIFRKCGLKEQQAVRVAEVLLSERPWLTGPEAKTLLADLERQGSTIARLNEKLAGVQGALMDAGDVLAIRTDGDYGASVREVVEQRDAAREVATLIIGSLRWTGDGYEWTGGEYDYRMTPDEAVRLTQGKFTALREQVAKLEQERNDAKAIADGATRAAIKNAGLVTELRNLLDAGKGQSGVSMLYERLEAIRDKLKAIVCTEGCDRGVVLLSSDGPTHYDAEAKCQVYDHENFSPLGDALIELWELTLTALVPPPPPRTYVGDGKPPPDGVWLRNGKYNKETPYFEACVGPTCRTVPGVQYTFVGPVPEEGK